MTCPISLIKKLVPCTPPKNCSAVGSCVIVVGCSDAGLSGALIGVLVGVSEDSVVGVNVEPVVIGAAVPGCNTCDMEVAGAAVISGKPVDGLIRLNEQVVAQAQVYQLVL